jgi:hypothetical protein
MISIDEKRESRVAKLMGLAHQHPRAAERGLSDKHSPK